MHFPHSMVLRKRETGAKYCALECSLGVCDEGFSMYVRFSQKLVLEGFKTSRIGLNASWVLIKERELSKPLSTCFK